MGLLSQGARVWERDGTLRAVADLRYATFARRVPRARAVPVAASELQRRLRYRLYSGESCVVELPERIRTLCGGLPHGVEEGLGKSQERGRGRGAEVAAGRRADLVDRLFVAARV